jgi:hypothetical protein
MFPLTPRLTLWLTSIEWKFPVHIGDDDESTSTGVQKEVTKV